MADNKLTDLLGVSMAKIKEMVDVETVIGDPITVGNTTLVPVSKISYGFAAGGSGLPSKTPSDLFGGGSGAGINITPIAFISVTDGLVQVLPIASKPDTGDKVINMVPGLVDMVTDLFKKGRKKDGDSVKSEAGTDSE